MPGAQRLWNGHQEILIRSQKIFVHERWLNPRVVLVLRTAVLFVIPVNGVVKNLADFHTGINANGLNRTDFQCPVAAKANVAKARRNVDEQSKAAHGRATL